MKEKKTTKSRKALKILWGIVAALVIIFIALMALVGGEPAQTMTPEEIKASANEKDLDIARSVWSAQKYEMNLSEKIQGMGTGETSLMDVYSYAGETKDFAAELLSRVEEVDMDSDVAKEYQETAHEYIATIYVMANDIREYVDTQDAASLEAVQQNLQLIPVAEAQFLDARTAYLKEAGYTDEEIAQRPTLEDGE